MARRGHQKPNALQVMGSKSGYANCQSCSLYSVSPRIGPKFKFDEESHDPRILIVSSVPNIYEHEKDFEGDLSLLVDQILTKVGLLEYCSKTYSVKCCPTKTVVKKSGFEETKVRPPMAREVDACRTQLQQDLDKTRWDAIITFGNEALRSVVNSEKKVTITGVKEAKTVVKTAHGDVRVWPIIHPAQILHKGSQTDFRKIVYDLNAVRRALVQTDDTAPSKLEDIKYRVVQSRQDIQEVLDIFRSRKPEGSYDIEATSLDYTRPDFTHLVDGISISTSRANIETFIFPLYHKEAHLYRDDDVTADQMLMCMYKCLRYMSKIFCHNLSYDAPATFRFLKRILHVEWRDFKKWYCTVIMHDTVDRNSLHNLGVIAESLGFDNYKDVPKKWLQDSGIPKDEWNYGLIPLKILLPYNAYDVHITEYARQYMNAIHEANPILKECWDLQLGPMSSRYSKMEDDGIFIDVPYAARLVDLYQKKMNELVLKFVSIPEVMVRLMELGYLGYGLDRSLQSLALSHNEKAGKGNIKLAGKLLNAVFYGDVVTKKVDKSTGAVVRDQSFKPGGLMLQPPGKMKSTGFATSKEARLPYIDKLKGLAARNGISSYDEEGVLQIDHGSLCQSFLFDRNPDSEVGQMRRYYAAHLVHEYSRIKKQESSYLRPAATKWVASDGLYHPRYNLAGTDTGRVSSAVHTIPKIPATKRMFVSRFEGGSITLADYAAIEVRLLASYSGDANLIQVFFDDQDIHRQVAAFAFKCHFDDVTDPMRNICKTVHFGIIYLEQSESIAARIMQKGETFEQCLDRVKKFKEGYFERFPGVPAYIKRMQDVFRKKGIVHPFPDMQKLAEKYRPKDTNSYIVTATGRYLPVPHNATYWERTVKPVNWPIQSAASDMTCTTVVKSIDAFEAEGMKSVVVFNTHDSIGVDTYPGEEQKVMGLIKEIGENPEVRFRMKVPAKMDFESGPDMGHTIKAIPSTMKKGRMFETSNSLSSG